MFNLEQLYAHSNHESGFKAKKKGGPEVVRKFAFFFKILENTVKPKRKN